MTRAGLCLAAAAIPTALLLAATAAAEGTGIRFADATSLTSIDFRNLCGASPEDKGWLKESMGAGAAWLDHDGDGHLDLLLVNGSTIQRGLDGGEPNRLFRGDGKGKFTDVTAAAGLGHRGWGYGVAVGDVDNDGDPDVYVTNIGSNVLFLNRGDGTFEDATSRAGVGGKPVWSTAAAFFDMEGDGDLDLYVGNYMEHDDRKVPRRGSQKAIEALCTYRGVPVACGPLGQTPQQDVLYRNDGAAKFTDVTRAAGVWLETPRYALGVVTADYDNDGDQDVYVANDSVSNSLWENRAGKFVDVGLERLVALNADGRAQAGMGTDFGDYNGDGWLDIVVTNFAHDFNTVYRNLDGRFFVDDTALVGMGVTHLMLSWGAAFHDFDRDADLDVFIANGHVYPQVDGYDVGTRFRQPNHLFEQVDGRFREVGASAGPALGLERSFRGAAFADYDNDGDVDILVTALDDAVQLLRNDSPGGGHYLQVRLVGRDANRDAVGARVTVTAGGRRQIRERKGGGSYLSASDPRLHFGLGSHARVETLEVRWPGGKRETLRDVAADRELTLVEGQVEPREP